jgi:hypothetical protein
MPIIIEGRGDGPTVWLERVSLAGLYLRSARRNAIAALEIAQANGPIEERIELAILAVIWSTLALEAAANEIGEDVFTGAALVSFGMGRKPFQKPKGVSMIVWKWQKLFEAGPKLAVTLSNPVMAAAERLVQTRHLLTHYRPQDTARKVHYEPPPVTKTAEGMYYREVWSAEMAPSRIEPSLVEQELLGDKAAEHYRAAWDVLHKWEVAQGGDGSKLTELAARL